MIEIAVKPTKLIKEKKWQYNRPEGAGRPKSTSINSGNLGTVSYDYTKSLLTKITRSASGKSQVYNLTYDAFGNMTKMAVEAGP